jgi:hypothetical protein
MNYPLTPTTQAVGLGFARPPLRGCGLQVEISFELETPGQHTFRTLHNTRDSALCNRRFHPFNVCTEKKRREKLNPVRRGLVSSPGDWPWSSWRYYRDVSVLRMDRLD